MAGHPTQFAAHVRHEPTPVLSHVSFEAEFTDPDEAEAATCTDPGRLRELAEHPDPYVAYQALANRLAPSDVLRARSHDASWMLREAVAKNPNSPDDVLVGLACDHDRAVLRAVVLNDSSPDEALHEIYEFAHDSDGFLCELVARRLSRPHTSAV